MQEKVCCKHVVKILKKARFHISRYRSDQNTHMKWLYWTPREENILATSYYHTWTWSMEMNQWCSWFYSLCRPKLRTRVCKFYVCKQEDRSLARMWKYISALGENSLISKFIFKCFKLRCVWSYQLQALEGATTENSNALVVLFLVFACLHV